MTDCNAHFESCDDHVTKMPLETSSAAKVSFIQKTTSREILNPTPNSPQDTLNKSYQSMDVSLIEETVANDDLTSAIPSTLPPKAGDKRKLTQRALPHERVLDETKLKKTRYVGVT